MSFCAKCGAELGPDSTFCGSCGVPVTGTEAVPAPAAPPAGAPVYGPPAQPAPGFQPPKSGGGGAKIAIFVLIGLLVVGAIVGVVLWLTLGGNDDQAEIEKVVQDFYAAMEKGDGKAIMALVDSGSRKEFEDLAEDYGYGDGAELLDDLLSYMFPEGDLKISGLEVKITVKGDTATVEAVLPKKCLRL